MILLPGLLLLVFITTSRGQLNLWSKYENCPGFTFNTWVCDTESILSDGATLTLERQLLKLQTNTQCQCPNIANCYRFTIHNEQGQTASVPIESGFAMAVIVVSKVGTDEKQIQSDARRIYDESSLGRLGCDNGILVIYAVEDRHIYILRGNLTYGLLTDNEMLSVVKDTQEQLLNVKQGDSEAQKDILVQLISVLGSELEAHSGMQSRSWQMLVGMIVACGVALLVLILLLGLCCYGLCNIKSHKHKTMNNYYYPSLGPGSFYDSIGRGSRDPIYIVSEPSTVYYPLNEPAYASLPRHNHPTMDSRISRMSTGSEQPLTHSLPREREREVQNRHMNLYDQVEM